MRLAFLAKNKIGFGYKSCVKYLDNLVLANQWERCNYVVLTWILNYVYEELYIGQVYSKLAFDMLDWRI
ncbi:hypothetical protein HanIR_Chr09g0430111 [Helianthus annuus]|nr:hypothetical protein HanIR_Chr09g0430111 [Helianthus annuus]